MRSICLALFLTACSAAPKAPEVAAKAPETATKAPDASATVPEIALADLKPLVAAHQVFLVDANGTDSYNEGHIPGAIDLAAHQADLASVLPPQKDALIVAYCGGPKCNAWAKGANAVAALGYTDIKHFKDGISGWKDSQSPVETVQPAAPAAGQAGKG